ncbi:MAG: bifunctional N-acetylglucosamine-1-phosphate uridyltransferase/glucosamine-1-phosphate acetyltransferase [Planctomycetes bacterium]|nr:bifunctional N-acetylglucosamine-1-phosphate uridyltransferase/glucosamine-1-phosphate acetyltransferase [Planctomycetota bacterium]
MSVPASAPARADSVVILAAGLGKRMRSARPKVLHPLCGRSMLEWVLDQALALEPQRIVLVVGHGADEVKKSLANHGAASRLQFVTQEPQLGTGHALQCCLSALGQDPGRTVVLYGDMPLLRPESVRALVATQAATADGGLALLTAVFAEPRGFGRIVRDPKTQSVVRIVEEKDCTSAERELDEVNLGVYCFDGRGLVQALPRLSNDNAQKEYYLTDVLALFVAEGRRVASVELEDPNEGLGVNTLAQLAEARTELQWRILEQHLENGVYIEDPASTYVDHGVAIGAGTRILPCTVIRSGVKIGAGCEVGPFTQLRPGTVLEDGAEVGNFTECKNSTIGKHTKAKHLAYIGDATLGANVNIGAGTIFANYDGKAKHKSVVEDGAFIGSGTVIVAPNTIGTRATTGAGAVVTKNSAVGASQVWVGVPAKRLSLRDGDRIPRS